MRIFDCFLYSGEKDILNLRLNLMNEYVHKFVIIESSKTFSGLDKKLYFPEHKDYFNDFLQKIEYHQIELPEYETTWEKEFYIRNQLKFISKPNDEDIIIIADVDEIVNLKNILNKQEINKPYRIELRTYYNFFNNQSNEIFKTTLISTYKNIKNVDIGNRNNYKALFPEIITDNFDENGGHFTYMFGWEIEKYIEKIKSFSHTELNTPYYTNHKRIKKYLIYNFDLFDRFNFRYKQVDLNSIYPEMYSLLINNTETSKIIKKFSFEIFLSYFTRYFDKHYWKTKKWHIRIAGSKLIKKLLSRK